MNPTFQIHSRSIAPGEPTYIIAELSANHHQDLGRAIEIVNAASEAGADAIKLQTYTPDTLTLDSDQECFRIRGGTLWDGRSLHELYAQAAMPWEWHEQLFALAKDLGLDAFSTAYDPSSLALLESCQVPVHKVASFELVDIPLIELMAATGKPLIMSTGMATLDEIGEAVDAARGGGAAAVALLHCTSAYPAPLEAMNLRTIPHLAATFDVPVGLSDHTLESAIPIAAVTAGACLIEKHLTLSRRDSGPDSAFSLEPDEFKTLVAGVRAAEKAMGEIHYGTDAAEEGSRAFRRSLFVVEDVREGERFTPQNVRSIRPATGLHPRHLATVLTRRAAADIGRGTPLAWELMTPEIADA